MIEERIADVYRNSSDSIFWVEVDKIQPNPFQPRREFDEAKLRDLSDSIRQYGILQPLVVTRKEVEKEDGGIASVYELIAGERRLRASKLAGVREVPVLIRLGDDSDKTKLELAIIENIQREDLNPIDRAKAFQKLAEEFGFTHGEVAKKVGKSREYVSNTIRILALPEPVLESLLKNEISEGHTRPILMLSDRPEEQMTLHKEIVLKKMTVREAERIARKIAFDRVRKKEYVADPEIVLIEEKLTEKLGTRVQIERKEYGGKVLIDFFSNEDLRKLLNLIALEGAVVGAVVAANDAMATEASAESEAAPYRDPVIPPEPPNDDESLYAISEFTI